MTEKNIRVRFGPSPTGSLHIGSLRTILFNYLYAKSKGGTFVLRIEDTDEARRVDGAVEGLLEIMDWLGLKTDEGPHAGGDFGPYVQSERKDIYDKYKQQLLDDGKAYPCFCTSERLDEMRNKQQAEKKAPRYDGHCRDLSADEVKKRIEAGEKYVIRQKMPSDGDVVVQDELRGEIKFSAEDLDDHVLIKSTGTPTYQFANVVDDHLMEISHVLRGEEWIPSFPKNILLYRAFNWEPPLYFHMPLTLNKEGGKLSKRQGDVAVEDYRRKGYLPEALINYSALLGWRPKTDDEIFDLKFLEEHFDFKDLGTSPAVFDVEKLGYLNGYYIRQKHIDELTDLCLPYLEDILKDVNNKKKKERKFISGVIASEQERLKKLSEITEKVSLFFTDKLEYEKDLLLWKKLDFPQVKENLETVKELLEKIPEDSWTNNSIEEAIVTYLKAKELKIGNYLWPMRVALSGQKASPSPFDIAGVLGKKESLERIDYAIGLAQGIV